jgi:hypothetical protein
MMGGQPPLDGATAIDYRGSRFAVGRTADAYGIWDLPAGGGPVLTFPLSHEGWAEAWRTYQYWEETAGAPGPPGPPPAHPAPVGPAGGQTGTQVTGSLTFANIIEVAARLYGRHAGTLIPLVAVVTIPLLLGQAAVFLALLEPLGVRQDATSLQDLEEMLPRFLLVGFVTGLIGFVINAFVTAAVTGAALDATSNRPVSFGGSFGRAVRRLHSVLWIVLLETLAVLAAMIVPTLLAIAGVSGEVGFLVALALLLAISAAFFILIRLLFSIPALMAEDRRGLAALRRSWELVSGRWWRTFGIFLLVALISGLVGLLFQAVAGAFTSGTPAIVPSAFYIEYLAAGIASALTTPFLTLVIVLLYLDARVRTEGTLEVQPAGAGAPPR